MPGGRALLFGVSVGSYDDYHLEALALGTGERRVISDGLRSFYSPSGHVVYGRGATIYAAPFDTDRLEVTAPSVPVVSDVGTDPTGRFTQFGLSDSGTLVYARAGQGLHNRRLVWKDRRGEEEPLDVSPDRYDSVRLSPDGKRALVTLVQGDDAEEQVFTIDLERGVTTQLTFDGNRNERPLFSPAGDRIALESNVDGQWNLYVMPDDASSAPARLRQSERIQEPLSWSPDGRFLVYREVTETENFDLWVLPVGPDGGEPFSLATTPYLETDAAFSPDGRWIAYSSAESGRSEIYLKRFSPEEGGEEQRRQVSRDGGWQPTWSRDGRELFFRNDEGIALMVVDVSTGADLELGRPRLLFEETEMPAPHQWGEATYDVAPDGRFLMLAQDRSSVITLDVVLNWFQELEHLVPTDK